MNKTRYTLALMVLALVFVSTLQGCETMKGAGEGMKKDYEHLQEADSWWRENMW